MMKNSQTIGATLTILAAILFMAGNVQAAKMMDGMSMDVKSVGDRALEAVGEPLMFVPATPATDISVVKTRCVDGFAVVYFNKDSDEYTTRKECAEASGGTAEVSRRVDPVSNGQGGKKCPGGTEEYINCTPTQPLPCCYTIKD